MLDKGKHEIMMRNILKDIYSDRLLSTSLGFKGGTACYFFYELPRFSVDLDFDLIEESKREEVFLKIEKILKKYGDLKKSDKKRNTLFFLLDYKKDKQNIKVEISLRGKNNRYEIKNLLGQSVLTMCQEDMFAHKLVAASERSNLAMRDFFDINFFLQNIWEINEEIIQARTGKNLKEYFIFLIDYVEKNINERNVLDGLGELLTEADKDSIKAKFKNDLLFSLRNYLATK